MKYSREHLYSGMEFPQKAGPKMEPWLIYDGNHVAAYNSLQKLCEYAGRSIQRCDELWALMLEDRELFEEFVYYLNHHAFLDKMKVCGFSMTDLYVQQLDRYNIKQDSGKNTAACNKEEMALNTFEAMAKLKKEPDKPIRKWQEGFGMDKTS